MIFGEYESRTNALDAGATEGSQSGTSGVSAKEKAMSDVPRWIPKMFRAASYENFIIGLPGALAPRQSATTFGGEPPDPAFPTQAWAGMAAMFGIMFREIARDPIGKRHLVRYAWMEKGVSALAIAWGYREGKAPLPLLITLIIADWAMIAPFIVAERKLKAIAEANENAAATDA